jgi:hypothetical protein
VSCCCRKYMIYPYKVISSNIYFRLKCEEDRREHRVHGDISWEIVRGGGTQSSSLGCFREHSLQSISPDLLDGLEL